jgi:hypothetical protein
MDSPNLNTSLFHIGFRISAKDIEKNSKLFIDIEETIIIKNLDQIT